MSGYILSETIQSGAYAISPKQVYRHFDIYQGFLRLFVLRPSLLAYQKPEKAQVNVDKKTKCLIFKQSPN